MEMSKFDEIINYVTWGMKDTGAKEYRKRFAVWVKFCSDNDINPLSPKPSDLDAFFGQYSDSYRANMVTTLTKFYLEWSKKDKNPTLLEIANSIKTFKS